MLDLIKEDPNDALVEIYTTERRDRHRVFRGRNKHQIEWKLDHHRDHRPELVEIEPAKKKPAS